MNPTSQQILVCKNMKAYSIKKIMNKKVTPPVFFAVHRCISAPCRK